jgi:protein-S-isoprenylcysteine O-methyltransferase
MSESRYDAGVRSLVQSSRPALNLLNVFFVVWLLSESWIRSSRPAHTGDVSRSSAAANRASMIATVVVGLFGAFLLDFNQVGPLIAGRTWTMFVVGIALGLVGIALRLWSVRTLGQFFQLELVVQAEHRVVRSGPYRILRHPSYAGAILTFAGTGLALGRWSGFVWVTAVAVAAFVHRITVEERLLVDGLGEVYASYRGGTWRLVPGLW